MTFVIYVTVFLLFFIHTLARGKGPSTFRAHAHEYKTTTLHIKRYLRENYEPLGFQMKQLYQCK